MISDSPYKKQVELLLEIIPEINKFDCFAIKGGTAINLFVRNLPRLSVDIDLTYLHIEPRSEFLVNIHAALNDLTEEIRNKGDGSYHVEKKLAKNSEHISKLFVRKSGVEIKTEPNLIFRGSVFHCESRLLCINAQNEFLQSINANIVSVPDLYAGKICAALNRQHPRDLFDIKLLLENEGISEEIRKALVIYLACDSRPMAELLKPNILEFIYDYENEFYGMTTSPVTIGELKAARIELIREVNASLTENERIFLLSVKRGEPNFSLLELDCMNLPALRWKVMNIKKMDKSKHLQAVDKLKKALEL